MAQSGQTQRVWSRGRIILIVAGVIVVVGLLAFAILKPEFERIFSSVVIEDCHWSRMVQVWNDANADRIRDADEAPLADVQVAVDDVKNQNLRVGVATSDANGDVLLSVFIPGCPETAMQIYVEAPVGFCPTTPDHVDGDTAQPIVFGLVAC